MARLNMFAYRPESFLWQVLYGQHGVGKSRLAKEWLQGLDSSKAYEWTVGFAPDDKKIFDLPAYRLTQPIAIVIDNADNLGAEVWTFLCNAYESWANTGHTVRVLLLAHTDLEPASISFERTQTLKDIRESRFVQIREAATRTQPSKATESIALPGISLLPLQDKQDKERILNSGQSSGIGESEAQEIINDTRGLPAFLALASRHPQTWNKKLEDYARAIIDRAENLFGERKGISLLTLSVLIAPVNLAVLEQIVPNTWSWEKVEQLFGASEATSKGEIPAFEPDLLGQEIIFQGLSILPSGYAENLLRLVSQERPDIFLQKVIDIWRRHSDPDSIVDRFSRSPRGSAALRSRILDALFGIATEKSLFTISSPLGGLSQTRAKDYVSALLSPSLNEQQYPEVVNSALSKTPVNAVSGFLLELHAEATCTRENRLKWAALLHHYCTSLRSDIPPELAVTNLAFDKSDNSFTASVLERLRSPLLLERSYAAFRLAEIMRDRKKAPAEITPHFREILDSLSAMLARPSSSDRISAAFAIGKIAQESNGKPGFRHFSNADTNKLIAALNSNNIGHTGVVFIAIALRNLWCSSYRRSDILYVIKPKKNETAETKKKNSKFTNLWHSPYRRVDIHKMFNSEPKEISFEFTSEQEHKRRESANLLSLYLHNTSKRNYDTFEIAFACLQLDCLNSVVADRLAWGLNSSEISNENKIEAVIRVGRQSPDNAVSFLRKSATSSDSHLQAVSIACLAQLRLAEEIFALQNKSLTISRNIQLTALANEVRCHKDGKKWNEPHILKLREYLTETYIANSGHLIHKLKAKNGTGRWNYYFILIEPEKEDAFLAALESRKSISLENYGRVVASNYGESPSDDVRDFLKEKYDFDV